MALTPDVLSGFESAFYSDPKNELAQIFITRGDPHGSCLTRSTIETSNHIFSHKISDEAKPVTNQKSSGRCWLFAAMNAMRVPFIKEKNLDEFEFSQGYLFFWDKIERSNYFLRNVVRVGKRQPKEEIDGRLMNFLLSSELLGDGGQWDMAVNIINKHGVIPKKCFPETFSCESSLKMNRLLRSKLREFAKELWTMVHSGVNDADLDKKIQEQMRVIYNMIGICLGIPPKTFTWEYYDKSKKYNKVGPISPLDFYNDHVKPVFNADEKVCIVSDPRPQNPVNQTYTVDCLGNVEGGKDTVYNNQPIETLIKGAAASIKAGEPVWFGCDIGKRFADRKGFLSMDGFNYKLVFGTDVTVGLSKTDRLVYGDSIMNHAMLLTGVHFDNENGDGEPLKWRIENSWGKDRSDDGYIAMTNEWFKEFVFEIVVDKKYLEQDILDVFNKEPIVLPAWDPMGSLAN